jgi:hypothetical protein
MTVTGSPPVLAEFRIALLAAEQRGQGVVLALGMAAGVTVDDLLGGLARDHRALVGRVAHTGGGELGQQGVDHRAQFR